MNSHWIAREAIQRAPKVRVVSLHTFVDSCDQPGPAAGLNKAKDRNRQRAEPDEKELQDFVEYRGVKSAEGHIGSDGEG